MLCIFVFVFTLLEPWGPMDYFAICQGAGLGSFLLFLLFMLFFFFISLLQHEKQNLDLN